MRGFLVVEGLIGVGKTSLCQVLEAAWHARLVLEPAATNPFLEPFYRDPARFAFPVQMFYLYERWRQQQVIRQGDLFARLVVSDYLFEKDRMFALKTLDAQELALYDAFGSALGEVSPTPDLVIYLDAPTSVLLERIAVRNRPGEEHIDAAYLDDLRARYEAMWSTWTRCPILRVENTHVDEVINPSAREGLLERVARALNGGADALEEGNSSARSPGSASVDREELGLFDRR
jgi:deoxyguanosine kinase